MRSMGMRSVGIYSYAVGRRRLVTACAGTEKTVARSECREAVVCGVCTQ